MDVPCGGCQVKLMDNTLATMVTMLPSCEGIPEIALVRRHQTDQDTELFAVALKDCKHSPIFAGKYLRLFCESGSVQKGMCWSAREIKKIASRIQSEYKFQKDERLSDASKEEAINYIQRYVNACGGMQSEARFDQVIAIAIEVNGGEPGPLMYADAGACP